MVLKTSAMESRFGAMAPRGGKKLKRSKMNPGGVGAYWGGAEEAGPVYLSSTYADDVSTVINNKGWAVI